MNKNGQVLLENLSGVPNTEVAINSNYCVREIFASHAGKADLSVLVISLPADSRLFVW